MYSEAVRRFSESIMVSLCAWQSLRQSRYSLLGEVEEVEEDAGGVRVGDSDEGATLEPAAVGKNDKKLEVEDCYGLLFGNAKTSEPKLVGDCGRHTRFIIKALSRSSQQHRTTRRCTVRSSLFNLMDEGERGMCRHAQGRELPRLRDTDSPCLESRGAGPLLGQHTRISPSSA